MMKKIIFGSALIATSLFAQVEGDIEVPYISYEIKMGKGFETVQSDCLMCHSFGYIINQGPQSRKFWKHKVEKMIVHFGAPISKKNAKIIEDYLFTYYGNGKEE